MEILEYTVLMNKFNVSLLKMADALDLIKVNLINLIYSSGQASKQFCVKLDKNRDSIHQFQLNTSKHPKL